MPDTQPSKRRGRPRVTEEQKKRHTLTFRMRDDLRDAIEEMAIIDKNTLSEQIESYVHAGVYLQAALMYEYEPEKLSPAISKYIQARETIYGLRYNKLDTAFDEAAEHVEDLKLCPDDTLALVKSRLSEEMHTQLRVAAEANKRSMNAEIVARLEGSFTPTIHMNEEMRPVLIKQFREAQVDWEAMAESMRSAIRHLNEATSTRTIIVEAAAKVMSERLAAGASTADLVKAVEDAVTSISETPQVAREGR